MEEIVQQVIQGLLQDPESTLQQLQQAGEQGQQVLQAVIQAAEQGDQNAQQAVQVLQQAMGQAQSARNGAKLNYIKRLNNICAEGEELVMFKVGGKLCKKCQKAKKASCGMKTKMEDGGNITGTATVKAFKCGRKIKKNAEGGDMKNTQKPVEKPVGKRSGKPMPTKYDDKKHENLAGNLRRTPAQQDSLETYQNMFKRMPRKEQQRYEKTGN